LGEIKDDDVTWDPTTPFKPFTYLNDLIWLGMFIVRRIN